MSGYAERPICDKYDQSELALYATSLLEKLARERKKAGK